MTTGVSEMTSHVGRRSGGIAPLASRSNATCSKGCVLNVGEPVTTGSSETMHHEGRCSGGMAPLALRSKATVVWLAYEVNLCAIYEPQMDAEWTATSS
jgi:hypothetical protein